ncbi:lipopolysaccharide biosynthesis protein [Pseudolysinimonas sp.]|uniref:lipopolysaccharide biosynthesis protein n=1 Tax=Pseudolysinimonas sp. TaxID=2680009 RepID=UPI003F7D4CEB
MTRRRNRPPGGASRALVWSFGSNIVSRLGTLAIGILLSRILGPEAFGTYAVAFVALTAVLSFNDVGVSLAIVRWQRDPREIAPTVATVSLIASVVIFSAGFFVAPFYAAAMGSPEATGVVRVLLIGILIDGLVAVPAALLQREFRQGTRAGIDQLNVWLGAAVSVALAILGMGAMSLAIGRVVGSGVSGIIFFIVSPHPLRFGLDRAVLRELLGFGLPLAGTSLIAFAIGYADQVVVGAVLGPVSLGFYVLAFNLSSWPVSVFSSPLRAVAPAAFSRLQDDPVQMDRAFRSAFRLVAIAALPVCFFLAGAAEPIVRFVYGEQWAPAAHVLGWLGLFGALRILFELSYDFLVVLRRSGWLLTIQAIWALVLVGALIGGTLLDGMRGAAIAQLIVGSVVVLPLYLGMLARSGVRIGPMLLRAAVPLLAAIVVLVSSLLLAAVLAPPVVPAVLSGLLAVLLIGGLLLLERSSIAELRATWAASRALEASAA